MEGYLNNKSNWLAELRNKLVIRPIREDKRNTGAYETLLGHSKSWIFSKAIGGGQANFDEDIEDLKPRDRAMLYAWFNQPGHVLELQHAFAQLLANPTDLQDATVIDVGCGPFTAGLALADVAGSGVVFRYFGIDTSKAMRNFGEELAVGAREIGALHSQTQVQFGDSLNNFNFEEPRAGWTIVVASYLLASKTLDVRSITNEIVSACDAMRFGPVALLYTNTARLAAREKYPELEAQLTASGFESDGDKVEVLSVGGKARDIHYALFVRPRASTVPIEWLLS